MLYSLKNIEWFYEYLTSESELIRILEINGLMLQFAPEEFRNNYDIAHVAINQNGLS